MQNTALLTGSICLSDIPRECIKQVTRKDGSVGLYVNCAVICRKTPSLYDYTHFISCAPKQKEPGKNYIFGDFKEYVSNVVSVADIDAAPVVSDTELDF